MSCSSSLTDDPYVWGEAWWLVVFYSQSQSSVAENKKENNTCPPTHTQKETVQKIIIFPAPNWKFLLIQFHWRNLCHVLIFWKVTVTSQWHNYHQPRLDFTCSLESRKGEYLHKKRAGNSSAEHTVKWPLKYPKNMSLVYLSSTQQISRLWRVLSHLPAFHFILTLDAKMIWWLLFAKQTCTALYLQSFSVFHLKAHFRVFTKLNWIKSILTFTFPFISDSIILPDISPPYLSNS